jgi:dTDP-4-dehydrorhamnose 3,5-epimerase
LCDDYYCPEGDGGVIYNDPNIGIDWWKYYDTEQLILSKKDLQHPTFTEFDKNNPF